MKFQEKRKYVRLKSVYPVELRVIGADNKDASGFLQGFTRDVSFEGLCVSINNFSDEYIKDLLENRSKIILHLNIPLGQSPVHAVARVTWAKKTALPYPQTYLLGLAYEAIDKASQEHIIRFAKVSRLIPRLAGICAGALVFFCLFLLIRNATLARNNRMFLKQLNILCEEQNSIRSQLGKIQAEKIVVAGLLKNIAAQSDALKNKLVELENLKIREEKNKNEAAIAALISERRQLEEKLLAAIREKSVLEDKFKKFTEHEVKLENSLSIIEGKKMILTNKTTRMMFQWLVSNQNEKTGLIASYDKSSGLLDVGFTYDQALSAHNFIGCEEYAKAEEILDFFNKRAEKIKGAFANAYDVANGRICEYIVHSGPSIYVGLAMLKYEAKTGRDKYRRTACNIGQWLLGLQKEYKNGALPGGPGLDWASTEHNIAGYAFLSALYKRTGEKRYAEAADDILSWIKNYGYNHKLHRFNRGDGDRMIATDTIALSMMVFAPDQLKEMGIEVEDLVRCVEENCRTKVAYKGGAGTRVNVTGFDFCSPSSVGRGGVISVEWTAQLIVAFKALSRFYERANNPEYAKIYRTKAEYYSAELEKLLLIRTNVKEGTGCAGLPYATDTSVDTGHGWVTPENDAISAASTNFAIFAKGEYNIFDI